jgi:methionyl aminopeptidase
MDEEVRQHYLRAGEVVQQAREVARETAEPGTELLEIVEAVESHIRSEGLEPAFPVNVSRNEVAAHFTSPPGGEQVLGAGDVLKIDIGAHSDGYIADTALTVNPDGGHSEIVEAVEEVLESALEFVEPGVTVGEFGSHVEKQVPDEYNVVQNLTGHYLGRYEQHAGVSIPNTHNQNTHTFEKGDAVAIEPFLSTGSGMVKNGAEGNIYKLESTGVRDRTARQLVKKIQGFDGLPFTTRWLEMSGRERMAFKKMVQQDVVHSYPVLRDRSDSVVAQAEHTVLVGMGEDGGNVITTRR